MLLLEGERNESVKVSPRPNQGGEGGGIESNARRRVPVRVSYSLAQTATRKAKQAAEARTQRAVANSRSIGFLLSVVVAFIFIFLGSFFVHFVLFEFVLLFYKNFSFHVVSRCFLLLLNLLSIKIHTYSLYLIYKH